MLRAACPCGCQHSAQAPVDSDIDFVGHGIVVSIPEIRINPIPIALPVLFGTGR